MNFPARTVGRFLFGIPFGIFGLFHFMNASALAGIVPIPGGVFWVYLTGVAHLAACISILIQKYTRLACLLLALMLIIFALGVHLPNAIAGDQNEMAQVLKDLALAGGALVLSSLYVPEPTAP